MAIWKRMSENRAMEIIQAAFGGGEMWLHKDGVTIALGGSGVDSGKTKMEFVRFSPEECHQLSQAFRVVARKAPAYTVDLGNSSGNRTEEESACTECAGSGVFEASAGIETIRERIKEPCAKCGGTGRERGDG